MPPIIMHLDMNSFFASCEQQDNLELRGKPVGVCEHLGGIIIAPSIEAKRWGIKTGTSVWEAKKLYRKIILVKVNASRYRHYSKKMVKLVSDFTGQVQQYSIDEVFLDISKQCNICKPCHPELVSGSKNRFRTARASLVASGMTSYEKIDPWAEAAIIAKEIKRRMKGEVGDWLRCSIGIASSKLVAKIASDMQKPDGLTVICTEELNQLYQKLSLTDVPGIGPRMEKSLSALGIKTLTDLRDYPESKLVARYGFLGRQLHRLGLLEDVLGAAVEADEEIKSMGHTYTLPKEFRAQKFFVPVLFKLCEMVSQRLRKQDLMGNIIHFYGDDISGQWFGKSKKLNFFMRDGKEIFLLVMEIFQSLKIKSTGFKFIGVSVSGLVESFNQQSLFEDSGRAVRINRALDKINDRYGNFVVCRAPVWQARKAFSDSVGFGRIKELAKERDI